MVRSRSRRPATGPSAPVDWLCDQGVAITTTAPSRRTLTSAHANATSGGRAMDVTIIGTGNMARGIATRALAGGHYVTCSAPGDREAPMRVARDSARTTCAAGRRRPARRRRGRACRLVRGRRGGGRAGTATSSRARSSSTSPTRSTSDASTGSSRRSGRLGGAGNRGQGGARRTVVKAFNTTFAGTLSEGSVAGQPLDVLIAGDDDDGKERSAARPRRRPPPDRRRPPSARTSSRRSATCTWAAGQPSAPASRARSRFSPIPHGRAGDGEELGERGIAAVWRRHDRAWPVPPPG